MRLYTMALALSLAGCTGGTGTEWGETYSIAIVEGFGRIEGFVLDSREVLVFPDGIDEYCSECDDARVDFTISHRGLVSMGLNTTPFCLKGEDFDSVEDIPSDISNCNWGWADLTNIDQERSKNVKLGYIVRDRSQSRYWRLRVAKINIYDDSPRYEAVFEIAEFEE